jgi:hypothetical protein
MPSAALGFRAHSGWAVVVVIGGSVRKPEVIERSRIETCDPAIAGSKQPYHAAEALDIGKADALIRHCRESSERLATAAVRAILSRFDRKIKGAGILFAAGRPLPDLAAILRSHALLHTAEGEFFREALVYASEQCSLTVTRIKEREIRDRAAAALGRDPAEIERHIQELGRALGPPWRQDQKLATLAAWVTLAETAVLR